MSAPVRCELLCHKMLQFTMLYTLPVTGIWSEWPQTFYCWCHIELLILSSKSHCISYDVLTCAVIATGKPLLGFDFSIFCKMVRVCRRREIIIRVPIIVDIGLDLLVVLWNAIGVQLLRHNIVLVAGQVSRGVRLSCKLK